MDPNRASADSMEAKLELWRQRKSLESTSSSSSTTSSPHSLSPVKKRALSEDSTRMSPRPKTTTTTTTTTENKENHKIKKTTGPPKTSSPVTNQRMKIQKSSASPTTCTTGMDIIPQRGTQNQNHIVVQTDQTSARSRVVNSHKVRLQNPTNISSPSPTSRCPHPFENPMVVTQIIQDSIAKEMASLKDMVVQTLVEQRQSVVVDEPEQLEMVQKEMKTKRATECFKALQHLRERVEFNSHHHMYDEYIRAIEKDTSLLDDSLETKLAENSALNFEKEILSQQLEEVRKLNQKQHQDPQQQQLIERLRQENTQMYEQINLLRNQYSPALEKASRKLNELQQELDETKEQKRVAMQMLADHDQMK